MSFSRSILRFFDISISLSILVILSPILLTLCAILLLRHGRPVFFRQLRVGEGGQRFMMIKFRTMTVCNDMGEVPETLNLDEVKKIRARYQTTKSGDARITSMGGWLRSWSLDELPQLINVLKGDMSLVGPRPCPPTQRCDYLPDEWNTRHLVRPGITGLAQIKGRSSLTVAEQIAYDLHYVKNASLPLYLFILFSTIPTVFFGKGYN